ncbi:hypothetical protein LguiA_017383 [Lonicera macranthoides]
MGTLLFYSFSSNSYFGHAELNKLVADNGLVESGVPTNVKKSSGSSSTEKQKHHYLYHQSLHESNENSEPVKYWTIELLYQ